MYDNEVHTCQLQVGCEGWGEIGIITLMYGCRHIQLYYVHIHLIWLVFHTCTFEKIPFVHKGGETYKCFTRAFKSCGSL